MRNLAWAWAIGCATLVASRAVAQPVEPPASAISQPATGQASPQSASNPWVQVPAASSDRCLAEAIGTASDPKTGRPNDGAKVDPKTGKPVCPPSPKSPEPER